MRSVCSPGTLLSQDLSQGPGETLDLSQGPGETLAGTQNTLELGLELFALVSGVQWHFRPMLNLSGFYNGFK